MSETRGAILLCEITFQKMCTVFEVKSYACASRGGRMQAKPRRRNANTHQELNWSEVDFESWDGIEY